MEHFPDENSKGPNITFFLEGFTSENRKMFLMILFCRKYLKELSRTTKVKHNKEKGTFKIAYNAFSQNYVSIPEKNFISR